MERYPNYLKIASFNIQCAGYTKQWNEVCEAIKKHDPDVIGIQECDKYTTRCGTDNYQMERLAKECGYPYWYFAATLENYREGQYGHGIMSKYPITDSKVIFFDFQNGEVRNVERHEIDVNGKKLCFYNTHLASSPEQYDEIQAMMDKDEYPILVGDLNLKCNALIGHMDTDRYITLNGGPRLDTPIVTTITTNADYSCIDHIVLKKDQFDYHWNEDMGCGIFVNRPQPCSDHFMVYTYVQFK